MFNHYGLSQSTTKNNHLSLSISVYQWLIVNSDWSPLWITINFRTNHRMLSSLRPHQGIQASISLTPFKVKRRAVILPIMVPDRSASTHHHHKKNLSWGCTLWLCQNSYWKWPFIVSFSIKQIVIFHSYVSLPEGNIPGIFFMGFKWWFSMGFDPQKNMIRMGSYGWEAVFWDIFQGKLDDVVLIFSWVAVDVTTMNSPVHLFLSQPTWLTE